MNDDITFKIDDGSTIIYLYPDMNVQIGGRRIEKKYRLQNGDLQVYNTGYYGTVDMKLKYVPYSDAMAINAWWVGGSLLNYYYTNSSTLVSSYLHCAIRNSKIPFNKHQEPYADLMEGSLKLEEV